MRGATPRRNKERGEIRKEREGGDGRKYRHPMNFWLRFRLAHQGAASWQGSQGPRTVCVRPVAAVNAITGSVLLCVLLVHNRCLQYVGHEVFRHFNVVSTLSTDERTMIKWLQLIEVHYHTDIAFHNSTHAADVLQGCAFFCQLPYIVVCNVTHKASL